MWLVAVFLFLLAPFLAIGWAIYEIFGSRALAYTILGVPILLILASVTLAILHTHSVNV